MNEDPKSIRETLGGIGFYKSFYYIYSEDLRKFHENSAVLRNRAIYILHYQNVQRKSWCEELKFYTCASYKRNICFTSLKECYFLNTKNYALSLFVVRKYCS